MVTSIVTQRNEVEMADQTIECKDCGKNFVFTEKDQKFYEEQKFAPPKRCRDCRALKKARNEQVNR